MNILMIIQRLKVLVKERQTEIVRQLKNSDAKLLESTQSQLSRGHSEVKSDVRSMISEKSEDKYKEKMEEVQKTIKEKEFLQKRTTELLEAIKKS